MIPTMTASPPPHTIKARANSSDGYYGNTDSADFDYSLQLAASSEAQLPYHSGSLSISSDDDIYNSGTSQHENHYHENKLQHHHSFNHSSTKPAQISRAKSDGTHDNSCTTARSRLLQTTPTTHSGTKRLHTIESGIALVELAAQQDSTIDGASSSSPKQGSHYISMIQQQQHSPQCQSHHPVSNQETNKSPKGSVSLMRPPRHPSDYSDSHNGSLSTMIPQVGSMNTPDHQILRTRHLSDSSYYSVDAGKHGFLTHHDQHDNYGGYYNNNNDSDVGSVDANSANGSLVFKHLPGQETTPAECALPASIRILPYHERKRLIELDDEKEKRKENNGSENAASILGVYGVECGEAAPTVPTSENGKRIKWHRNEKEGSSVSYGAYGSRSSIVFDVEQGLDVNNESPNEARNDKDTTKKGSPPNNPSSLRIPCLPVPSQDTDLSPRRVLPHHERKRLMELEEEEKRKKNSSKNSAKMQQQSKMNKATGRGQRCLVSLKSRLKNGIDSIRCRRKGMSKSSL
mmetsp:Transcript_16861/g.27414  ORF Transcript_16861/g.27414 Transcript_16861/m.27414 type:complete len:517 (-) Transcript_16861:31-1581(-)